MKYISLFSGIEAVSCAWEELDFEPLAFSEVDKWCSAFLAEQYPNIPNLGDITKIDWKPYAGTVDLVVGGSPCQSFSIAGNRAGLKGKSGLMFEYVRAIQEIRPRWLVWENVPGALSVENGKAFEQLITELANLGYGLAWRVLDAQFFGVPQRRRRVFLVGYLGNPESAAKVLFEQEGLRGDYQTSRNKREELTSNIKRSAGTSYSLVGNTIGCSDGNGGNGKGFQEETSYALNTVDRHAVACLPFDTGQITSPDNRSNPQWGDSSHPLTATGRTPSVIVFPWSAGGNGSGYSVDDGTTPTLLAKSSGEPAFVMNSSDVQGIAAHSNTGYIVRRLTPRECERLQGFPDDYTLFEYKGKPSSDSKRYKALGNSMAVPVMRWIGERILKVEKNLHTNGTFMVRNEKMGAFS